MRALLAILALLALPATASAQNQDDSKRGIYFDVRGGFSHLTDSDIDIAGVSGIDTDIQFDDGYVVEIAAGYEHPSGFRGEIALGYRTNDIDDITVSAGGATISVGNALSSANIGLGGDVQTYSAMANGYYGLDVGGGLRPFVGAGVGVALIDATLELTAPGQRLEDSDNDTVFAYQGMAGLEYVMPTDLGPIALGVRYTYFATADPEFGGVIKGEYGNHSIMLGVRFIR